MKALKINAPVNLNTGATLSSGSLVVITEGLAQVFTTKEGSMNAQIVNAVYTSVEAFESGEGDLGFQDNDAETFQQQQQHRQQEFEHMAMLQQQ
jgi:TRAP-type uncharacterized transport system substrate-binding protein